jgi:hypothetical protein
MDLVKVLEELRGELDLLNEAILSLEQLQQVKPRRGRPSRLPGELAGPATRNEEMVVSAPAAARKAHKAG